MKQILFVAMLLSMIAINQTLSAQAPSVKAPTTTAPNIGNLMSQFTDGINPSSFTDKWADGKAGFLGNAGKIAGAAGLGQSITSLAGFIKPEMFTKGFNIQSLLSTAATVKTMTQATGLLKNLEGGLKPEAFVSGWAGKRSGWLSALSLIK
jgi:hypothetical protein